MAKLNKQQISGISDRPPIIIVAAGSDNMSGWAGSENGPRFDFPALRIWDTTTQTLRGGVTNPINLQTKSYDTYGGVTIGGGKNTLAVAFAYRMSKETGRDVVLVFNCRANRPSSFWIAGGRDSVDWVALNTDIYSAIQEAGATEVDYFLWQQGEADAQAGQVVGAYDSVLDTLRTQAMAEGWWGEETVMLVGRPCSQWPDAVARNYLINEINTFGDRRYSNVGIVSNGSLYFEGGLYLGVAGDEIHYDGRALYSLGYFNYFDAIPSWNAPSKKSLKDHLAETPYPPDNYVTTDAAVAYSSGTLTTPRSKYNLEPSITRVGSRFFVAYTANKTNASEGEGSFVRLTYTDDEWTTVVGVDTPFAGFVASTDVGSTARSCAGPKLWACPDGSLWCFFHQSNNASVYDGIAGVWLSVCRNPLGSNPRWSKPKRVVQFGWTQDPLFIEGNWYLPVSSWRLPTGGGNRSFIPGLAGRYLYKIDYSRVSVEYDRTVSKETSNSLYDEHWIYPLLSGRLRAIWRTTSGPYFADATDYHGTTWTEPAPYTDIGTPRPSSKTTGIMSPTGRFLIAYNNATNRTKMTLGMSDQSQNNSLLTFTRELESGGSAYPSIYADGTFIWVAIDQGNRVTVTGGSDGGKIMVKRVTEANLAAGVGGVGHFIVDAGA